MLVIAFFALPSQTEGYVVATRYLGSNTRISSTLWIEPKLESLSGRLALDRLKNDLIGKYIRQPVETGARITGANVMPWPDLPDEDIVPIPLERKPD